MLLFETSSTSCIIGGKFEPCRIPVRHRGIDGFIYENPEDVDDDIERLNTYMKTLGTDSAQALQDKIVSLHQMQYYARHGDYLTGVCAMIKTTAQSAELEGWKYLQKRYWTDINEAIVKEKSAYSMFLDGSGGIEDCPTSVAVPMRQNRFRSKRHVCNDSRVCRTESGCS